MAIQKEADLQGSAELISSAHLASERLFRTVEIEAGGISNLPSDLITERAKIYRSTSEFDQALNLLKSISLPVDETIQEYIDLAKEHVTLGDQEIAVKILKKAVSTAKHVGYDRDGYNVSRNFSHLTLAFAELGQASLAVSTLNNVKGDENSTFRSNTLYDVVYTLAEHGYEQSAVNILGEFADEEDKAGALGFIAQALMNKGDTEGANKYLEQLSPHGKVRVLMANAESLAKKENFDEARQILLNSATILSQAKEGYTIMWQHQLVDFSLESLHDFDVALLIAGQMPPEFGTITSYVEIAEAQAGTGDKEAALTTLQLAEQKATQIPKKARVEDSRLKADAAIAEAYISLALVEIDGKPVEQEDTTSPLEKAEKLILSGQMLEAVRIIDQEFRNVVTYTGKPGDEYVKWARELYYSLNRVATLYSQAGEIEKAKETVESHFSIVSSTRDHENQFWYNNVLWYVLNDALTHRNIPIAEQVADEISLPALKSHTNVEIASSLLAQGKLIEATGYLKNAEQIAGTIDKANVDHQSRCYLEISNNYLLLEKTLQAA